MDARNFALASAGALMLAACGGSGTADKAATPTPTATAETGPLTVAYTCEPAMNLTVTYDRSSPEGGALVVLGGTDYPMDHTIAASGARYEILPGRSAGKNLVWWNKGTGGMLMEGTPGNAGSEKIIATCAESAPTVPAG